jgi:hypothetical protein
MIRERWKKTNPTQDQTCTLYTTIILGAKVFLTQRKAISKNISHAVQMVVPHSSHEPSLPVVLFEVNMIATVVL